MRLFSSARLLCCKQQPQRWKISTLPTLPSSYRSFHTNASLHNNSNTNSNRNSTPTNTRNNNNDRDNKPPAKKIQGGNNWGAPSSKGMSNLRKSQMSLADMFGSKIKMSSRLEFVKSIAAQVEPTPRRVTQYKKIERVAKTPNAEATSTESSTNLFAKPLPKKTTQKPREKPMNRTALEGTRKSNTNVDKFNVKHEKKQTQRQQQPTKTPIAPAEQIAKVADLGVIEIIDGMSVAEMSSRCKIKSSKCVKYLNDNSALFGRRKFTVDTNLSVDLLELLALEHDIETKLIPGHFQDVQPRSFPADRSSWQHKPPVVTIMGHVDHGKTSLLDAFRKSSVAAGEAGGITQHLSAFIVPTSSKNRITFVDTPGHAAFSSMRERGANATDIVVLVVAADDGVMPQTKESIKFARAAGVPMVVAINKIDKINADVQATKDALVDAGVMLEDIGGDVQCVEVSALNNINLDGLEDAITTAAELAGVSGDRTGLCEGVVLESRVTKGEGAISTILVRRGTLKPGAFLVSGTSYCRARGLTHPGTTKTLKSALPSEPIELSGWKKLPNVGDLVLQVKDEKRAREVIEFRERLEEARETEEALKAHVPAPPPPRRLSRAEQNRIKKEPVEVEDVEEPEVTHVTHRYIIKCDVTGSQEAITDVLMSLTAEEYEVVIVDSGIGDVTSEDILQAKTTEAVILCFNSPQPKAVTDMVEKADIRMEHFSVIYSMLDFITARICEALPQVLRIESVGKATVLEVFELTGAKKAQVAGSRVESGSISKASKCRLWRDDEIIFEGDIDILKRHKDDVKMVKSGNECGISFADFSEVEAGDIIECYEEHSETRTLDIKYAMNE